jgi:APA family basic amino acid/polyamine antiporter
MNIFYNFFSFSTSDISPVKFVLLIVLFGLICYFVFIRHKTYKESKIVRLVIKLLPRRLAKNIKRREIRKIIREKNAVVLDRFDRLIQNCPVLDFEESITINEFFDRVAYVLSNRLNIAHDRICKLLWIREKHFSTVIIPGLAIPHLIIPGKKIFDIVLARCKKGIIFGEEFPPVNIAFILIGTRDERNFHLKTLASIAQIAQDKEFNGKCLKAKTIEDLRKVILLTKRDRFGPN